MIMSKKPKKRTKKYRHRQPQSMWNKVASNAQQFSLAIAKHDMTQATEEDADTLTISPLMNIERLSTGKLDDEGYIDLNEANVAGFCIAARIFEFANDASKSIIAQAQPIFEDAAEAIAEIGLRKVKRGKYIATGDELNLIREGIRMYREVILVAERGHVMTGLMRAKEMVDEKLQKVWKEAA